METLLSLSKSECKAIKELLETEDEFLNTQVPSTPPEPDLIDLIDLEILFNPDAHLKPDLSSIKKKSHTFPSSNVNKNVCLFLKQVSKEIEALPRRDLSPQSNLTAKQKRAFQQFKQYTHLTIK